VPAGLFLSPFSLKPYLPFFSGTLVVNIPKKTVWRNAFFVTSALKIQCHVVKTECLVQRELKTLEAYSGGGRDVLYTPSCDEKTGFYEPLQKSLNGSTWCVEPVHGKVIENSYLDNSVADCLNGIIFILSSFSSYYSLGKQFRKRFSNVFCLFVVATPNTFPERIWRLFLELFAKLNSLYYNFVPNLNKFVWKACEIVLSEN